MTKPYRLPTHARPSLYQLHIHARVDEPGFQGIARIHLRVDAATDRIELHARDLDLRDVTLQTSDGQFPLDVHPDPEREMVALTSTRPIAPGDATLSIAFAGKISQSMTGLYLSQDGPERCLATQCEETEARGIFPCFDEPAFKARFELTVTTSPEVIVLGNAPLVRDESHDDAKTWRFEPTAPMSSYLFAMAIGRFASTPVRIVRDVPLRVWAVQGKEPLGTYGNDLAQKLLPWFETYFGQPYRFAKYDQLAVPSFSAGAMENSGLVIFRQSLLLRDAKTTSWQQEKLIARVIAHEFAHQWFGNLVTMAWWDDIWLNESFAEWMAHKSADAVAPEYALWADFHENKRDALVTDALETTHAIYTPVETPEEATELFDTVTYSKGSVLMRMIERFLGEDAFRAGLRTYMAEFAEKNARGEDLWRHLERASGHPVDRLARSWILQPGYPIVRARVADGRLHLAQRRFFSKPDAKPSEQTWSIPIVLRYADDSGAHEVRHLFETREGTLPLPVKGRLRWLDLNADGVGFYRQELAPDAHAALVAHAGDLSAAEQRDVLDDAWALVRAGARPIDDFLGSLGPVLAAAKDHHVIAQGVEALDELEDLLLEAGDTRAIERLRAWARELLAPEADRLGYVPRANDTRDDAERRAHVLRGMAKIAREPAALAAANALADDEARDPERVDATLAGPAVSIAARFGDASRHARHYAIYEARRDAGAPPQLTQRYLYSLAQFEEPALLTRTLMLLREGKFPLEAIGPTLRLMLQEPHARVAAWEHMKADWAPLRARIGDMWTGFLVERTGDLPARLRDELVRFYDANLHGVAQQSRARALEAMDARGAFLARVAPRIGQWLDARAPPAPGKRASSDV